jgi:hypothetical protein
MVTTRYICNYSSFLRTWFKCQTFWETDTKFECMVTIPAQSWCPIWWSAINGESQEKMEDCILWYRMWRLLAESVFFALSPVCPQCYVWIQSQVSFSCETGWLTLSQGWMLWYLGMVMNCITFYLCSAVYCPILSPQLWCLFFRFGVWLSGH